ncbi:glycosyltransferase family 2 protein [[Mycoplasma] testudinis]|uniref:glycosyltransferase family 2 protein n=1 Tax=[Mycoplasma] testudinis TaxID=33924 RepID=UPI000563B89C|nr:glycosyltransferase family 2 protein [[Mycoplasma] testudinis]
MPSFSIIIPTYNCAPYLKTALESISNQKYDLDKIEILVIDDGSIDNTPQIVNQFKETHPELNLQYFYKDNQNWGSVLNFVKHQKLATKDYITVLDADDTLNKNIFKNLKKININNYDLVISDFHKKRSHYVFHVFTYDYFLKHPKNKNQAQTPFCVPLGKFAKKELFYDLPDFKEKTPYQDAYYSLQLINQASKIRHLNKSAGNYYYKRIGNSMSLPWQGSRYLTEVQICLDFLKNDSQELVAFHLLRRSFRKLVKENLYRFPIKRSFKFQNIPWYARWTMRLIYFFFLKSCFRKV